jgi:hypothetical protein
MNARATIQPHTRRGSPGFFEVKPTPCPWSAPSARSYGPDDLLINPRNDNEKLYC